MNMGVILGFVGIGIGVTAAQLALVHYVAYKVALGFLVGTLVMVQALSTGITERTGLVLSGYAFGGLVMYLSAQYILPFLGVVSHSWQQAVLSAVTLFLIFALADFAGILKNFSK